MLRTLIVEDESTIRRGLIATFDWEGVDCKIVGEAQNGAEGFEMIKDLHPDLIITDINMPEMDGLTMLQKGLEVMQFHSIILTGYSEFEYAQKAIGLHVQAYILKPINREALAEAILSIQRESHRHVESILPELWTQETFEQLFLKTHNSYHISYVTDAIKNRYSEQIRLEQLADELFVSQSYLSRKIREDLNSTFTDLLYKYRLQEAVSLLRDGKFRVNEVACMTGFHDYKHFNSVCNKYLGTSATDYLNQNNP